MDTLEKTRLFVLVSLYRRQDLPALHTELSQIAGQLGEQLCLNIHLAARHFPSTWGRVSRAQPAEPDPDCLQPDQLQDWKRWHAEGRIGIVPAGYAGACLPVLSGEEIRAEFELAVSNSWKSGIRDIFGVTPALLLPFWPDPRQLKFDGETLAQLPLLGLGLHGSAPAWLLVSGPAGRLGAPYLSLEESGARQGVHHRINEFLKHLSGPLAVIQQPYLPGQSVLAELVKNLALLAEAGWRTTRDAGFAPLEAQGPSLDPASHAVLQPLVHPTPRLTPDFRARLQKLPEGRHGRSATQDRLRAQLLATLPHDDDWRLPIQAAPDLGNRLLIANMEGEASIMADNYEARFSAGIWQGFFQGHSAARQIRFRPDTGTAMVLNGRTMGYTVDNSVSFETDHSRGLRNLLSLDTPDCRIPGRMVTDYILTDHGNQLLVDVQLRYPWIEHAPVIDEVHPYRFSVALPADASDLRVRWQHLKEETEETSLWGSGPESLAGLDGDQPETVPRQTWWQRLLAFLPRRAEAGTEPTTRLCDQRFFGHQWVITWQTRGRREGLAVHRLPAERASSSPMELCVQQEGGKGLVLDIYPEGRYLAIPSGDLRSLNHHFVVGISPIFDDADPADPPAEKAERECAPFYMVRES